MIGDHDRQAKPPSRGERLLRAFKPGSLLDWWTLGAFIAAVVRLFLVRNLDFEVLSLYLTPPVIAFLLKNRSDRLSTRIVAALFLTSIDVGIAVANIGSLFPKLGSIPAPLSVHDNRLLTWYLGVDFIYISAVIPPFLFGRCLVDRYHHVTGEFWRWFESSLLPHFKEDFQLGVGILGLASWVLCGPPPILSVLHHMGFWPVIAPG